MNISTNGSRKNKSIIIKALVITTFPAMVIVNALANILPINGVGTGEISDSYPNLFAPTGLTFTIWGLIYILLAAYTVYQTGMFQKDSASSQKDSASSNAIFMDKIGLYFSVSSIANLIWIFTWHYRLIPLSMILMLIILVCLINITLNINKEKLSLKERALIRLPFSVYFGWITVATIANATTLLVYWNWNGSGIAESTWTILILLTGLLIGTATVIKNRDIAYGLVIIWAYAGILLKHISESGFASKYPGIIITLISCIVLMLGALGYVIFARKRVANRRI